MEISQSHHIPHRCLRPVFDFWNERRGPRAWPRRDEITLDALRGAASNTVFCRIERPYRDLDSIHLANVGTAIERATGQHLTGLTVGQLLRGLGSSREFTHCFSEYGLVATQGGCTYNEGRFPWPDQTWLAYRRLVMPLGGGEQPDGLFVVIDLNARGLGLRLPAELRALGGPDSIPAQPWSVPALRVLERRNNALPD